MTAAEIALAAVPLLIVVLAWFARRWVDSVEMGLRAEVIARQQALEAERKGREDDRHDLRQQINAVGAKLSQFELEVARECINGDRLAVALQPLVGRMDNFRDDIKELFKTKQDKVGVGD